MKPTFSSGMTRREVLRAAGLLGLGLTVGSWSSPVWAKKLRTPGSLPFPKLPEGTDTLPEVEHIIILMMENHSFDSYFGMLNSHVGFPLKKGVPKAANPDGNGNLIHAFHMPTTCQQSAHPSQSWNASHTAYDGGKNDGFVLDPFAGPVAMGYWTGDDIPFYYGLAKTFPLASRWFGSTLCQTYPNRRFLMAGTAAGIINTTTAALGAPPPPNGNIFDRLDLYGISWLNYFQDAPSLAILLTYAGQNAQKLVPVSQFFTDAAAGTLPSVSLVDPNFGTGSEENPQDIRVGEQFASQVINAVMSGPGWAKTALIWTYDEHGGYYDHVPPPAAIPPDDIPPNLGPNDLPVAGYDRYGFRVPAVIVSPYAKPKHVSTKVRDHTAVLKFIERKWNIGALTYRDANSDDLSDCFNFKKPAFLTPPTLPAPLADSNAPACTPGDPGGPIPPPEAVTPAPASVTAKARALVRPAAGEADVPPGIPLAEAWAKIGPAATNRSR